MRGAYFDIETDGLLPDVSVCHCIVVVDLDTREVFAYHDSKTIRPRAGSISDGLAKLREYDFLVGHNIVDYDLPVLEHLFGFKWDPLKTFDTLIGSKLIYSDRKELDFKLHKQGRLPGKYIGAHSLAAWGHRLENPKGEYDDGWERFSKRMLVYCVQDCSTGVDIYQVLRSRVPDYTAETPYGTLSTFQMETLFARQLGDMQRRGAPMSFERADELLRTLVDRQTHLEDVIRGHFPPLKVPYKVNSRTGKQTTRYCPVRKEKCADKLVPFNPGSRQQLAARLMKTRGWVPAELTRNGNPAMREDIMHELGQIYPEVEAVSEYLIVSARLGMLNNSPNSYMRLVDEDGLLHGRCNHIGTVTHRCSHSKPNQGNITSVRKPYGLEMRSLFVPFDGMVQAGFDADGLELRMLAHYLARWDDGAYGRAVHSGDKALGTDPHSLHAAAISEVVDCDRDTGKTATYAFLYGAGDRKLGAIFGGGTKLGRQVRAALRRNIPGLGELIDTIEGQVEDRIANHPLGGFLISLDGRRVGVRKPHAALNSLLQTAGAVVMKWVTVMLEKVLPDFDVQWAIDYLLTGHVHDELQGSLNPELQQNFTEAVNRVFELVTEILGLRVPLAGTADFGSSWASTH